MASEEMDEPCQIPAQPYPRGKYLLVFDPLDGSGNIDVNVSVGSIFSRPARAAGGVAQRARRHARPTSCSPERRRSRRATRCTARRRCWCSAVGNGVAGFTLDPNLGEFMLTHPNIQVPADTQEFAINASNSRFWEPPVKRYVDECLAGKTGPRGKDFNMRWIASMVAEAHRILMRGGVFMYPRDTKDPAKPGRLRLLYEANPIGFVMEQAGGRASTGRQPMLACPADRAAPAHRPRVRLEERGRAHRALPRRAGDDRTQQPAVRRAQPVPRLNFEDDPCRNAIPSSPSPAPRAPEPLR